MKLPEGVHITNIVNYNRKSRQDVEREKKTGEDTLFEIIKLMTGVLDKYGIPYVQKNEVGSGDKIESRPVFQEVLKDLENGVYDAIGCKELSRLARGNFSSVGIVYDLIVDKRIFIITPWKLYDPKNPSDLRQIRFELFLSREEFELTRERLIGGKYSSAMQGKYVGNKAPYGYMKNKKTQRLTPDDEECKIVKMIFELYLNGTLDENGNHKELGSMGIALHLQRLGISKPSNKNNCEWNAMQIRRILTNEVYIGEIHYGKTIRKGTKTTHKPKEDHIIVKDAHEPIIDSETWEKVQNKINNKKENLLPIKTNFSATELAGLIICGECGCKMTPTDNTKYRTKKNGEVSTYYSRILRCYRNGCAYVQYNLVEKEVVNILESLINLDSDKIEEMFVGDLENDKKQISESEYIKEQLDSKRKNLEKRLKFIFEKYESGVYSDEDFVTRKKAIEKELLDLSEVKVYSPEEVKKIDPTVIKDKIKDILFTYNKLDDRSSKNKILRGFFNQIVLVVTRKSHASRPTEFALTPYISKRAILDDIMV